MFRMIRQWRISRALDERSEPEPRLREREQPFCRRQAGVAGRLASPAPDAVPSGLHQSVMDAVRAEANASRPRARRFRPVPVGVIACLLAVVATAPFWVGTGDPQGDRVADGESLAGVPQAGRADPVVERIDAAIDRAYAREIGSLQADLLRVGGFFQNRLEPIAGLAGEEES